ncbi:hypothetical protein F4Z99_00780 [Candidatus Poribacteria bacterium]|nr:hypothetical protein [Candidatus Poribacteria bacterium]
MKTLISFSILILAFTGCTSVEYQQIQNERDTRREVYEDARRKEFRKRSRDFLSDDMLGKWRFLELVVEERGGSEDILKAKAALAASKLEGLRLRFWKNGDNYFYRLENLIDKSYGTYATRSVYRGDEPQTGSLRFYPISGSHISDLIFNFTRGVHRQVLTGDGEVFTTQIATKSMKVSVKESQLDLELDLGMVLSPDGWLRRGNIRCSLQRIE